MTPQPTTIAPKPSGRTSVGEPLDPTTARTEPIRTASGRPSANGHGTVDTHALSAVGTSPTTDHSSPETQPACVGGGDFLKLRIWADLFADTQKAAIAAEGRAGIKADGTKRKNGTTVGVLPFLPFIDSLRAAEHQAELAMHREYRKVAPPELVAWQKTTKGIGEHQLAWLLGNLGDPYTAIEKWHLRDAEGNPVKEDGRWVLMEAPPRVRTISELWSYCGHGDPTRKRSKGMTQEEAFGLGNPTCKSLVHQMAVACMKQMDSPFRAVYDAARVKYAGRDWTDGHRHNAALRLVGKEILRSMWLVRHQALTETDRSPKPKAQASRSSTATDHLCREIHGTPVDGTPLTETITVPEPKRTASRSTRKRVAA